MLSMTLRNFDEWSPAWFSAPQIRGDFPLAGARTGPAWRHLWSRLADGTPHIGRDLARDVAEIYGLTINSVQSLLAQGAQVGLLERQIERIPRGKRGAIQTMAVYRRATATTAVEAR